MAEVCIGLDVGTTGCKAVAMDAKGRVRAHSSATYGLYTDETGSAEQDAPSIWRAVQGALKELAVECAEHEPVGLALGGAMHSLLPLGSKGEPLGRASTWADSRAASVLPELRERCDPHALYAQTGCPLETPYHPARLRWLRAAAPEVFGRAASFVGIKDWLAYRLGGELCTDVGLASTTGLLEIRSGRWSDQALELAGVSAARLPPLALPTEQIGGLCREAALRCGLREGLPVVLGSSDGGLANLGSDVRANGETIVTVGTSGAVRQVADSPQLDAEMRTWCYLLTEGHYFAGGAINSGGLMLEWVRRTLYSELPKRAGFKRLLDEAERVESHGLLCLPYLTGERSPHWNALVRGALFGLSEHHGRAHVARAALEGIAFCIADVWGLLKPDARPVKLTGGLSRAPLWGQLVADTLGVRVQVDSVTDASALGAAVLGWAAVKRVGLEDAPRPGAAHGENQGAKRQGAERQGIKRQSTFVPDETVHEQRRTQRAHFKELYGAVDSYSRYTLDSQE